MSLQVQDPPKDMLTDLFDMDGIKQLTGEGDVNKLLMVIQGQADIVKNADSFLLNDELLPTMNEGTYLSQIAYEQTLAVQKERVSF